jgi:hypothetical protein
VYVSDLRLLLSLTKKIQPIHTLVSILQVSQKKKKQPIHILVYILHMKGHGIINSGGGRVKDSALGRKRQVKYCFAIKARFVWMLKFNKYCSIFVLFDKKFSILD